MPVPSSYNDLKEGVDFREFCGWAFYQRTIAVPFFALGERVMLRFAAVTHHAKVFLNGHEICCHVGGFLPFEVQLNEWLKPGDNLLTVAVDNPIDYSTLPVGGKANMMAGLMGGMGSSPSDGKKANNPNFDFFNYAGITRQVSIYTTPAEHIDDIELVADVQDETGDDPSATISYKVAAAGDADCRVELLDAKGQKVAESSGAEGELMVEHATLWQPGHAYLYQVRVTFGDDVYELPYDVRTVRVDGERFLINGRPFYFKGYGKHEDTFPAGRGREPQVRRRHQLRRRARLDLRPGSWCADARGPQAGHPRPRRARQEPRVRGHVEHRQRARLRLRGGLRVLQAAL